MNLSKRLLLAGAAPFALAAVYGGSIAFAQSGEPTPSTETSPTAPADLAPPTSPAPTGRNSSDCPEKGGAGGSGSDTSEGSSTTQTRSTSRGGGTATIAY